MFRCINKSYESIGLMHQSVESFTECVAKKFGVRATEGFSKNNWFPLIENVDGVHIPVLEQVFFAIDPYGRPINDIGFIFLDDALGEIRNRVGVDTVESEYFERYIHFKTIYGDFTSSMVCIVYTSDMADDSDIERTGDGQYLIVW